MKTLIASLFDRPKATPGAVVIVYSRTGCGCCEQAMKTLTQARERRRFTVEIVDVDTVPDLKTLYDAEVPVIVVNGKVRFRGKVNPILLDRLLSAEGE